MLLLAEAGAAADRHSADEVAILDEADQVGGVDFRADQDERRLRRRRYAAAAGQPRDDRRGDLPDIARPLGEVGIGQRL